MPRVLLLLPTSSYRVPDFIEAARRLGAAVTVASEERNVLAGANPAGYLRLDFDDLPSCRRAARDFAARHPLAAVLGADDSTVVAAAAVARALGLTGNPESAAAASRDKLAQRRLLRRAGVAVPDFWSLPSDADALRAARRASFPCVLKPTRLAASQGVIRADDREAFAAAFRRIAKIIAMTGAEPRVLVEAFVGGPEVAMEGILDAGRLRVLAVFDKPDPLEGPYFEETIYVRPSRLPSAAQRGLAGTVARAARALGLVTGPVHAELRLAPQGPVVMEIAARPIGGRCSRALRIGDLSLEELVLGQALGRKIGPIKGDLMASGVMMIPVPRSGTLAAIEGLREAKAVPGITEIQMLARVGQVLEAWPEGSRYPGFIFARARTPEAVEKALRRAHARLKLVIYS